MSEQSVNGQSANDGADDAFSCKDPVRWVTLGALVLTVLVFVWYVASDRLAPWTDQARVQAFVVPIAAEVSGRVTKVNVVQDQPVKLGDLLVEIDPEDYKLAVQEAEAQLDLAGQEIGASTDQVAVAEAALSTAKTDRDFSLKQSERYLKLAKVGTISKADADKTRAAVANAEANVSKAEAELAKAKEQLGPEGQENPKIQAALAALDKARRDLVHTKIYAPSDGGITNLTIDEGHYANAGTPLLTFVSVSVVWVEANMRENSLGHLKPGNPVDILLDMAPGQIFKGEVVSRGFAVQDPSKGATGDLVNVKSDSGWLRSAQRFPVVIKFNDDASAKGVRGLGGQADVQVYTGDHTLLNLLGWIWIRVMSVLSYVY